MKIALISALSLALTIPAIAPVAAQDVNVGVGRSGVEMRMRGDRDNNRGFDRDRDRGGYRDRVRGRTERVIVRRHRDWDRCRMVVVRSFRHGVETIRRIRRCG